MSLNRDSTNPLNFEEKYLTSLEKLTNFNQALVYGFDPEKSVNDETNFLALEHGLNQHFDMLEAYLYAQNHILPSAIQIGIQNITSP